MTQVFDDHSSPLPGQVYASRNWNEVLNPVDRSDIDFRLQLRLIKDPKRKNVRPSAGDSAPFSQYPADVAALREKRRREGEVPVDGKYGNMADSLKYLKHPPRFLDARAVSFQCRLRESKTPTSTSSLTWNSLPFRGGGTFDNTQPLQPEKFPTDMVAFSAWRSQHKDVGVLFGNQRAQSLRDIRWTTSLRSPHPDHGPNRTEGHRSELLGKKKWYFSEKNEDGDVKLNYIHNVRHILPM